MHLAVIITEGQTMDAKRLVVEVGCILGDGYVNKGHAGRGKSELSPEAGAWVKQLSLGQFPK